MTAQDFVASSLRLIGVLASGESLPADMATDGLASLNDMLDSWSTNNLLIPNKVREVFSITSSKQSYTMGSSGSPDWSTSRPMWIENVLIQQGSGQGTLEFPLEILTKDQWAEITTKQIQSTYPIYCYVEGTYPNETINFWPIPNTTDNVVVYSSKPLSNLATLTTALSLPPGYQRAIRYSLAIELAPEYGKQIPESVAEKSAAAIADIKRINHRPKYLYVDDALRPSKRIWNWRNGEPT